MNGKKATPRLLTDSRGGFLSLDIIRSHGFGEMVMDEFFFSLPLDSKKSLCIGPITRREAANLPDSGMGDGTGLYMFVAECDAPDEVNVIARIGSYDVAATFAGLLRSGKLAALAA